ncbi:MAG TPA: hypothetical protein VJR02_14885 [Pyrinomonadaceae bacterium]|nr:hypothetical protein [Pyrinomonadaceae bacterium]
MGRVFRHDFEFSRNTYSTRPFDPDVVWQVFSQLFARFIAHLPYLVLDFVVFVLFVIAARHQSTSMFFFWTNLRQINVLRVIDGAITGIKLALDEAGIDIPYPHTVVLNQASTSSDGASQPNS